MSECPICFETMDNKNNNIKTECGHEFHSNCFLTNVAHNGFDCPCCRKELVKTQCTCDMYDSYDDDSETSNDHDERSEFGEELPFHYIIDKLKDQISKRDLLSIFINSYRNQPIEEYTCIDNKLIDNYVRVVRNFIALTDEEREIELMTMEDIKGNEIRANKLIDDIETIINTRVY